MLFNSNQKATFLTKPIRIMMVTRSMWKWASLLKTTKNTSKLLNAIEKKVSSTEQSRALMIYKPFCTAMTIYQPPVNIMSSKDFSSLLKTKEDFQKSQVSLSNPVVEKTDNISQLSGLVDLQAEWINAHNEIPEGVKKFIIVMYIKVLHTFAFYEINTYQKFLEHIDKFFQTCQEIFEEFPDKTLFRHRYMSTLQHILISFLQDKKISIDLFEVITEKRINYDMYPTGNALLAIESYVIDTITKESSFSFVMINSEVSTQKKLPFTIQQSQLLTGQQNCDSLGISASVDSVFKMTYLYSDVKMHSCSPLKGQFTLKPDLCHSKRSFSEYVIAYDTALGELIKKRKEDISVSYKDTIGIEQEYIKEKLDADHPINEFFIKVKSKREEIFKIIKKYPSDKSYYKFFTDKDDVNKVKQLLKEFNAILFEGMTVKEISSEVSIGLSADPGQASLFKEFYRNLLESTLNGEITKYKSFHIDLNVLVSSTLNQFKHRKAVYEIIELFPQEVIHLAKKGINLIDNLS